MARNLTMSAQLIVRRLLSFFLPALVFFVPWQTAIILREGHLGELLGVWQYGTIQSYALDVFILTVLGCGAYLRWKDSSYGRLSQTEVFLLGVLVVVALSSCLWSLDRVIAASATLRLVEGVGVYWLFRTVSYSRTAVGWWWIAGALIQSGLAIEQFSAQTIEAHSWLGIAFHSSKVLGDAVIENSLTRWLRAYGSFPHPNILGIYLSFAVVWCFTLLAVVEQKWKMYLLLLSSAIISAGLFFTFSREAIIALIGGGVLGGGMHVLVSWKKGGRTNEVRFSPVIVGALACCMVAATLMTVWWEPVSVRIGVHGWYRLEQKSVQERMSGISQAVRVLPTHLEGVGVGQYTRFLYDTQRDKSFLYASQYQPVHVMPLLALLEVGLVGWCALMLLIVYWVRRVIAERESSSVFSSMMIVSLLIVPLFSDHFYWTLLPGILMWWIGWAIFVRKPLDR